MKFLLLMSVMVLAIWLWRSSRESGAGPRPNKPSAPLEMVGCSLCGIHVPAAEALEGRKGVYCCQEHRQRAES
jgi:uncharacterized protein